MMIYFHLDARSGIPTYLQLVNQVRHAVRSGTLRPGVQLPAAREVVAALAINPNTVFKAYRELEREGLLISRPGLGTFIAATAPEPINPEVQRKLHRLLDTWLNTARQAGIDRETAEALFTIALDATYQSGVA
jgi:DNA-binding transcriptional regulator YhcF (GntR family)